MKMNDYKLANVIVSVYTVGTHNVSVSYLQVLQSYKQRWLLHVSALVLDIHGHALTYM